MPAFKLPSWPWPKWILVVAFTALIIGLAVKFHKNERNEWDDVYRRSAAILRDGGNLYREEPLYTYPPFMAWGIIPFTYLSRIPARIAWFIVNACCLLAMVWLAWKLVFAGGSSKHWFDRGRWLIFGFGLFLGLRAGTNSVLHHQTDLLLGVFLLLGLLCLQRRLPHLGAVSFGLAAAMKCTPLLFVVYYLWRGPRLAAVTLVAVALGANFLPQLTHPPPDGSLLAQTWATSVVGKLMQPTAYPGQWNVDVMTNQSFAGSVHAWMKSAWTWNEGGFRIEQIAPILPPLPAKAFVYGMALLLLATTLWLMRRTARAGLQDRLTQAAEFSCFLLLMLLISPMSHRTHFTTLLVPGFVVGLEFWRRRSRRLGCLLAVLAILQVGSLRLLSVDLSYFASWHGAQMLSTLTLLFCCWVVIEDRLAVAEALGGANPGVNEAEAPAPTAVAAKGPKAPPEPTAPAAAVAPQAASPAKPPLPKAA